MSGVHNCVSDNDGGIYFYSDMNNGITNLFDAIDFTIDSVNSTKFII